MKKFTSAGVSKDSNGRVALRATNREEGVYAKLLEKEGHKDVHIVALKAPMSKDEIRKYLKGLKAFQTPEILKCLSQDDTEEKKTTKAKKEITKPTQSKKSGGKKSGGSKKKKETPAVAEEVPTPETSEDETDVHQEHDIPAAAKHFAE